eukprot:scaffold23754_cov106-Isochrysis_galbana.AAC.3
MAQRLREIHATFFAEQHELTYLHESSGSTQPPIFTLSPATGSSVSDPAAPAAVRGSQSAASAAAGPSAIKPSPLGRGSRNGPPQSNGAPGPSTPPLGPSSLGPSSSSSSASPEPTPGKPPRPLAAREPAGAPSEYPGSASCAEAEGAPRAAASAPAAACAPDTSDAAAVAVHTVDEGAFGRPPHAPARSHTGPMGGLAGGCMLGDAPARATPLRPTSPLSPPVGMSTSALPTLEEGQGEMEDTPDVRSIVRAMSEKVLEGVHCVFGGPTDVLAGEARPPEVTRTGPHTPGAGKGLYVP